MFRSKLGALVFVGGVLFAVLRMVGTESNGGELATAGDRVAEQRMQLEARQDAMNAPADWYDSKPEDNDWGDDAMHQQN